MKQESLRQEAQVPTTAEQQFWKWFGEHERELFDFETDQEGFFDQIASQLKIVNPDLTFEFGPKKEKREFIISAGGIKRAFPAVSSLAAAAPQLDRWVVTAFRPRRTPLNIVEFQGKRIRPQDVQFSLLDNGKTVGIYLFIPTYTEGDTTLKQIGYLLLDDALGEYDVELNLALIRMYPPEANVGGERHPFPKLPQLFDDLIARLVGTPRHQ